MKMCIRKPLRFRVLRDVRSQRLLMFGGGRLGGRLEIERGEDKLGACGQSSWSELKIKA